jgi:hypothetical protein
MLGSVGVDWGEVTSEEWERRQGQLVTFRRKYGHTNVAVSWDGEPGLGAWLEDQRRARADGALTAERVRASIPHARFGWQ